LIKLVSKPLSYNQIWLKMPFLSNNNNLIKEFLKLQMVVGGFGPFICDFMYVSVVGNKLILEHILQFINNVVVFFYWYLIITNPYFVLFLLHITSESRCQFHQRFTRKFFVRISPQSLNITRKSCQNYICTKNSRIKCWWNWLQVSISSTFYFRC